MLGHWKRVFVAIFGAFLGLWALDVGAAAQCPLPDNLDGGPCCAITSPKLPQFPNFTQGALDICWRDCNVDQVLNCQARWSQLLIISKGNPCGQRYMKLDLFDPFGLKWTGNLLVLYARTWLEIDPAGNFIQVWRFLVNGDLSYVSAVVGVPCPVPPCVPVNGGKARFTGYLDYARSCNSPLLVYQEAWMLTHTCDFIDHHVGFPRAGVFHPDRSYTFVGPAAGFAPGPLQPTEGTPFSPFEDLRKRKFPPLGTTGPVMCRYEEPIHFFSLTPFQQLCLCGQPTALPQWLIASLMIDSSCGTTVFTPPPPGGPYLPGFVSMGIGTWTIPGTYPGVEALRWNAGGYDVTDPCPTPVVTTREVHFGVTTIGGYPAMQLLTTGPGVPLPLTFIDQSNSLLAGAAGTTMNIPYVSNLILNLNQ